MPRVNFVTSDKDSDRLNTVIEDPLHFQCTKSGLIITLLHYLFNHYKKATVDGDLESIQFLELINEKAVAYDRSRRRRA